MSHIPGSYCSHTELQCPSHMNSEPITHENLPLGQHGLLGANLFVYHLPESWKEFRLLELFSQYGVVTSCRILRNTDTGRGQGFGFVCFEHPKQALEALRALDGYRIPGRSKKVRVQVKRGEEAFLRVACGLGPDEAISLRKPSMQPKKPDKLTGENPISTEEEDDFDFFGLIRPENNYSGSGHYSNNISANARNLMETGSHVRASEIHYLPSPNGSHNYKPSPSIHSDKFVSPTSPISLFSPFLPHSNKHVNTLSNTREHIPTHSSPPNLPNTSADSMSEDNYIPSKFFFDSSDPFLLFPPSSLSISPISPISPIHPITPVSTPPPPPPLPRSEQHNHNHNLSTANSQNKSNRSIHLHNHHHSSTAIPPPPQYPHPSFSSNIPLNYSSNVVSHSLLSHLSPSPSPSPSPTPSPSPSSSSPRDSSGNYPSLQTLSNSSPSPLFFPQAPSTYLSSPSHSASFLQQHLQPRERQPQAYVPLAPTQSKGWGKSSTSNSACSLATANNANICIGSATSANMCIGNSSNNANMCIGSATGANMCIGAVNSGTMGIMSTNSANLGIGCMSGGLGISSANNANNINVGGAILSGTRMGSANNATTMLGGTNNASRMGSANSANKSNLMGLGNSSTSGSHNLMGITSANGANNIFTVSNMNTANQHQKNNSSLSYGLSNTAGSVSPPALYASPPLSMSLPPPPAYEFYAVSDGIFEDSLPFYSPHQKVSSPIMSSPFGSHIPHIDSALPHLSFSPSTSSNDINLFPTSPPPPYDPTEER